MQVKRAAGRPASLWLRLSGLRTGAPSLAGAQLEVNAELAALLQSGDAEAVLAERLAEAPSLQAFFVELQNMVDTLSLDRWVLPPGCVCCLNLHARRVMTQTGRDARSAAHTGCERHSQAQPATAATDHPRPTRCSAATLRLWLQPLLALQLSMPV